MTYLDEYLQYLQYICEADEDNLQYDKNDPNAVKMAERIRAKRNEKNNNEKVQRPDDKLKEKIKEKKLNEIRKRREKEHFMSYGDNWDDLKEHPVKTVGAHAYNFVGDVSTKAINGTKNKIDGAIERGVGKLKGVETPKEAANRRGDSSPSEKDYAEYKEKCKQLRKEIHDRHALLKLASIATGGTVMAGLAVFPGPTISVMAGSNILKAKDPIDLVVKTVEPISEDLAKLIGTVGGVGLSAYSNIVGLNYTIKYRDKFKKYYNAINTQLSELKNLEKGNEYYQKRLEGILKGLDSDLKDLGLAYNQLVKEAEKEAKIQIDISESKNIYGASYIDNYLNYLFEMEENNMQFYENESNTVGLAEKIRNSRKNN